MKRFSKVETAISTYRQPQRISLNSNCNIFPKMISFLVFCQFLVSSTFLPFSQLSTFDLKIFIWPETFLQNKINIFLLQIWKNKQLLILETKSRINYPNSHMFNIILSWLWMVIITNNDSFLAIKWSQLAPYTWLNVPT